MITPTMEECISISGSCFDIDIKLMSELHWDDEESSRVDF